jgi:hypothetical protein
VDPAQLAGFRVERDDGAARAGGGVERAADHERRPFELELGAAAEIVRLESPRDLETAEVVRGDLIERRVARAARVAGVVRPLAVLRARRRRLPRDPASGQRCDGGERGHEQNRARESSRHRGLRLNTQYPMPNAQRAQRAPTSRGPWFWSLGIEHLIPDKRAYRPVGVADAKVYTR